MILSIVHRATGVALYFGTLLLAWWLIAAASGPSAYSYVQGFMGSFIGRLIVFGYTWALLHHLLSGIRHFVWDLGYGFKANERAYLDEWPMSEEQKQAVLDRDLNRCIALGGNIYFLAKIGATDGKSFQQMAGSMTGMTEDQYRDMMVKGGRSVEGNRYTGEKK